MARINPQILKRQRLKLRLSMKDVADRSDIDTGTIYRIESGKLRRNAGNTVTKLANVLKITPDELTAATVDDADSAEAILYFRSQLNVRISNEARNALLLTAERYGVRPVEIIELAPLLFYLVAEESLNARRDRLLQLRAARTAVSSMQSQFPHITERLVNDWPAEELEFEEERSISKRDIRGSLIDSYDGIHDVRPGEYVEGEHDPFVTHIRERLAANELDVEFDSWYAGWSPQYVLCKEEALAYFDGDEDVAHGLLHGVIGLHEIPKELRGGDAVEARTEWARHRIAEVASRQVDLLDTLTVEDLET